MIIILGGTGLAGSHLKAVLEKEGREVWAPTRQDLSIFLNTEDKVKAGEEVLIANFKKASILVNTLGIAPGYGEDKQKSLYQVQTRILEIVFKYKIPKIISFSALSHYQDSAMIPYLHYKYLLDEMILANCKDHSTDVKRYIIKPSLIFSPQGKSTQFFKLLSKLPFIFLPKSAISQEDTSEEGAFMYKVAPITIEDLSEFVMTLLDQNLPSGTFDVGSHSDLIAEYLWRFNPTLKIFPIPESIFSGAMNLLKPIFPGIAGHYAFMLLRAGSTPVVDDFEIVMGRKTTSVTGDY